MRIKKFTATIAAAFAAVIVFAYPAAADAWVTGYIENNKTVIANNGEEVVLSYYDKDNRLCGSFLCKPDGGESSADTVDGFSKIKAWFVKSNEFKTVIISSRNLPSPSPTLSPTATPTAVPTATPEAAEEENTEEESEEEQNDEQESRCSISISCKTALSSSQLSDTLAAALPKDGFLAKQTYYEINEDTTVYDILLSAAEDNGLEITGDSSYIRSIGGIGEFDCGPLSGWMYCVNGKFPMVSVGGYTPERGDEIEFLYTCDLGKDLQP